jgi:hypothetical protein
METAITDMMKIKERALAALTSDEAARFLEEATLLDADGCTPSSDVICRALNVLQRIEVHLSEFCVRSNGACRQRWYQAAISRLAEATEEANGVASALVSKLEEGTMPSEDFLKLRKALLWLEMMETLPEHEQLNGQPAFGFQRVAEADRCLFANNMDRILKIGEKLEVTFATRGIILIDAKATSACLDHVVIVMSTALLGVRKDASRLLQLVGEMWSISDSISSSTWDAY